MHLMTNQNFIYKFKVVLSTTDKEHRGKTLLETDYICT